MEIREHEYIHARAHTHNTHTPWWKNVISATVGEWMLFLYVCFFVCFFVFFFSHTMVAGGHFGYCRRMDVNVSYALHPCVIELRMYSILVIVVRGIPNICGWEIPHRYHSKDTIHMPLKVRRCLGACKIFYRDTHRDAHTFSLSSLVPHPTCRILCYGSNWEIQISPRYLLGIS